MPGLWKRGPTATPSSAESPTCLWSAIRCGCGSGCRAIAVQRPAVGEKCSPTALIDSPAAARRFYAALRPLHFGPADVLPYDHRRVRP
jgi:hypothetical protein